MPRPLRLDRTLGFNRLRASVNSDVSMMGKRRIEHFFGGQFGKLDSELAGKGLAMRIVVRRQPAHQDGQSGAAAEIAQNALVLVAAA